VDAQEVGKAGLAGWRGLVADRTAAPVTANTPLDEDQWRALVGAAFFAASVFYVVTTVRRMLAEA
jgi:hypothetical protein